MRILDTTQNQRIPIFLEMARRMSLATDPNEVLSAYLQGMSGAYGPEAYVRLYCEGLEPGQYRVIRIVEGGVNDSVQSPDDIRPDDFPVRSDGFLADMVRNPNPKIALDLQLHDDPVLGNRMARYQSALAVPMYIEGRPDNWIIMFHQDADTLTDLELEESVVRINMLGSNIRSAVIARELHQATEFIQREIETIAALQRALLPEAIPAMPGLRGAAHYETFDRAGGDYYDFRPLPINGTPTPNDPWAIVIADAAGHGPAAAVVMAMLRSLFHSYLPASTSPSAFLEYCNAHLQSPSLRFAFVTAFVAIYEPQSRTLRYARAGHEAPLLMQSGQPPTLHRLDAANGFPLGIGADLDAGEASVDLAPGQSLVLYTDGITEAQSPAGDMFREAGIETALRQCSGEPHCIIDHVMVALKEHEGGIRPRDDQTIVALQVLE